MGRDDGSRVTERKSGVLPNHEPRRATTIRGWPATLFGLPFLAAGIAVALIAVDVIPMSEERFHAPRWVTGFVGWVFAGVDYCAIFLLPVYARPGR